MQDVGADGVWAGFTPVVWLLLALAAFLGVICNELAQIIVRQGAGRFLGTTDLREAPKEAEAPVARVEGGAPAKPTGVEVEIYCVKCRDRRTIRDPETVTLANKRPAYQGSCPVCGTRVTRIRKVG